MNEGELGDKYKAMVGTMDVLKPDWDRIKKKKTEEDLTSCRLKDTFIDEVTLVHI